MIATVHSDCIPISRRPRAVGYVELYNVTFRDNGCLAAYLEAQFGDWGLRHITVEEARCLGNNVVSARLTEPAIVARFFKKHKIFMLGSECVRAFDLEHTYWYNMVTSEESVSFSAAAANPQPILLNQPDSSPCAASFFGAAYSSVLSRFESVG